uniref:Uncharacterized protein n=1 Tax=Plectus sambesii TaxID=2011161 RepID=A0A914W7A9_9BILA
MTRTGSHHSLIGPFVAVFCRRLTFDYNSSARTTVCLAPTQADMDCGPLSPTLSLTPLAKMDRKSATQEDMELTAIHIHRPVATPPNYLLNTTSRRKVT